jgi:hypothetical protein
MNVLECVLVTENGGAEMKKFAFILAKIIAVLFA